MQSKVISDKLTGWCPDGFTREALKVGDIRDFGAAESGLMQANLIEPADEFEPVKVKAEEPVKEPELVVETTVETVAIEPETVIEPAVVVEQPYRGSKKKNK